LNTLKILAPTLFRARGIDHGCVVDFLGAQLRARIQQQPQAPKPHLDCITLQHAEYNTWISSQYQNVRCGFTRRNIPQWNATKTLMAVGECMCRLRRAPPLAFCNYTSWRRFNLSSTNIVVTKTSIMLNP